MTETTLLQVGPNCHDYKQAGYATVLIDYANYYRALHEAICKAKHSIFVLGWDIDSRIHLLRGEERPHGCPVRFFDLIRWKAKENPDLKIYLNRWKYAFYLMLERELFSEIRWRFHAPENIQFVLDGRIPYSACHHQKIIVIDDEVAFCGGMDIAQCRWDRRQHFPKHRPRMDPQGTLKFGWRKFGPYHDIQIMVTGDAAYSLAKIVRERWKDATGKEPVSIRQIHGQGLPHPWPESFKPHFENTPIGISLTRPPYGEQKPVYQIERLYLDMIARAECFIYVENQYLTYEPFAKALNARLKEKPQLRVLVVSSHRPEGIMERKAMWHRRVKFSDIVQEGVADRVAITYPVSNVNGVQKSVRIHSKLMIVDDTYLRIGSSNINNRSMRVDTECDLVVEGCNDDTRRGIAFIRNDLIREHTGRKHDEIESLVTNGAPLSEILEDVSHSRQHLRKVKDEKYRRELLAALATAIADPMRPFFEGGA